MYQPPHFREDRRDVQHALIKTHSLGLLITAGPGGLQANYIPFLIDPQASDNGTLGTLRAHLARANPQLRELAAVDECLVVFQGPQAYVSPSLYPTKRETGKVVPTWNYITVQAWGRPQVMDDAAWIRGQIDDLTRHHEAPRAAPWAVADAPETFVAAQIKGIVGVQIPIACIEGKLPSRPRSPSV
ncbi:MAG: FMN-binding negative transcriptional regulator [Hyphomicrobiales bacterium]|nr:FMN-binding negative transcriptional regulator [Hyphomicrobiales bacterium]